MKLIKYHALMIKDVLDDGVNTSIIFIKIVINVIRVKIIMIIKINDNEDQ